MSIRVKDLFDKNTNTLTYIVYDPNAKDAIVIDPVLDFNSAAGKISFESIEKILTFVLEHQLNVKYILETHAHADHLTGAQFLKKKLPGSLVGINSNISIVQETFNKVLNLKHVKIDGSQFDILLDEDNVLDVGTFEIQTIFTPGHTPACSSFLIDGHLFTGDAIFMPDSGTGRCDFPKGSAKDLYHSIHEKLYKLPDDTKIYVGHDYQPEGRELMFQTTIGEQKEKNIQLTQSTSEADYIEFRTKRDEILDAPKLLLPSIQINIDAGKLPPAEENEVRYLKLPISEKI